MGEAMLSAEDKLSWDFHVNNIPHGFKVVRSNNDTDYFFCASCDLPVEP
jgi:hypothetical protein